MQSRAAETLSAWLAYAEQRLEGGEGGEAGGRGMLGAGEQVSSCCRVLPMTFHNRQCVDIWTQHAVRAYGVEHKGRAYLCVHVLCRAGLC